MIFTKKKEIVTQLNSELRGGVAILMTNYVRFYVPVIGMI